MSKQSFPGIWHTTAMILFGVWLQVSAPITVHAKDIKKTHVLVLNSYEKGFPWTDNIIKGIESVFKKKQPDVVLKIEYMDSKTVKYDPAFKKNSSISMLINIKTNISMLL